MKTFMQKTADVQRNWHLTDANGKVLGRFAVEVAKKLIGKQKPTYTPHIDAGDYVIVINAAGVEVTRNKAKTKTYSRHSNYPGGLSEITFEKLVVSNPEEVIRLAVYNMLPKNKLRTARMERLKIYPAAEHPHTSQVKES